MSELGGEKIDIIPWSEDALTFVANSLSPAKVLDIEINEDERKASIDVADDQLSLAIGKGGQNVRLAAKLTGWRIDIKGVKGEEVVGDGDGIDSDEGFMKLSDLKDEDENIETEELVDEMIDTVPEAEVSEEKDTDPNVLDSEEAQ
jgi:N utilization substance protein A